MLDQKEQELKELQTIPDSFECPITHDTMLDLVIDKEGNSFERAAIMDWLRNHNTSPVTRNPLYADDLTENRALRNTIREHYERIGKELSPLPSTSSSEEESTVTTVVASDTTEDPDATHWFYTEYRRLPNAPTFTCREIDAAIEAEGYMVNCYVCGTCGRAGCSGEYEGTLLPNGNRFRSNNNMFNTY